MVNTIGISANLVSKPKINIMEQPTSLNIARIREASLPIPSGSGNDDDIWLKSFSFDRPCTIKRIPKRSLSANRATFILRLSIELGNKIVITVPILFIIFFYFGAKLHSFRDKTFYI